MNTNFQTKFKGGKSATNEWYTPPVIIKALGKFDLDPATSEVALELNNSASNYFTEEDNGLIQKWFGRVWLNPPYSNPLIGAFIKKLAEHGNGIALVYNRMDSSWMHDYVLERADSILFLRKRIRFLNPNGCIGGSPGAGSCLIAYGDENTKALRNCGMVGKLVCLKRS